MNMCKCGCGIECKHGGEWILGHNLYKTRKNRLGKTSSKEHCNSISKALTGRHLSEEHKRKSKENNAMRGTILPKKQKIAIGKASLNNNYALGYHHTEKAKYNIGLASKGEKNNFYGKNYSPRAGHGKWSEVHGIKCQCSYEPRFIKACFKYGISVERNEKSFYFKNDKDEKYTYSPDFYCKDYGIIEVKGIFNQRNLRNLNECKKQGIKILLVFKKQLIEFEQSGILNPINILETDLSIFPVRIRRQIERSPL